MNAASIENACGPAVIAVALLVAIFAPRELGWLIARYCLVAFGVITWGLGVVRAVQGIRAGNAHRRSTN